MAVISETFGENVSELDLHLDLDLLLLLDGEVGEAGDRLQLVEDVVDHHRVRQDAVTVVLAQHVVNNRLKTNKILKET
jgi:hypothetical protein